MRQLMAMAAAALLALPGALLSQETDRQQRDPQTPPGKEQGKQQMPDFKPGKEHQALKQFDGDWEYKSKCMIPGQEMKEGQGMETCKLGLGGFWLEVEDKGTMMNKEFSGKGFIGWDPNKKKYVGAWVDSWMPMLGTFEGEADSTGKIFTFTMKGEDAQTGKPMAHRMVFEFKDQDHRTLRFYSKDESGKEMMASEITYTRKPAMIK